MSSTSPRSPKRRASAPSRVTAIEAGDPAGLAAVLAGATAFVAPSHEEGAGTSLIEAFSLGVPVIHSDTPAYVEVSGDAGISVPIGTGGLRRPARRCRHDRGRAAANSPSACRWPAADRARAFSWRDSAERVWQLHADL